MADSSKISILLFLFTLLFSAQINGRESQFFNKIPSINTNVALSTQTQPIHVDPLTKPATAQQEPTFIPENQNGGYGLYGHQSAQLSPTTSTSTTNNPTNTNNDPNGFLPKYLPKNYNTVAYVTQPEGYTQPKATNNDYYSVGDAAYVRDQSQGYSASIAANRGDRSDSYPTNYNANANANGYNSQQQSVDQKSNYNTNADNTNYYNSNSNPNVEKQGMSDTRFMENGRYFYDINLEGNSNRYPVENTRSRSFGDQYQYNSNNKEEGGYNSQTFGDQYQYNSNNKEDGGYNYGSNDANQGRIEGQDEQFQDFQNQNQRALP